jgi:hypothetical protein
MNHPAHDFVTVDMRGLKAALLARARADRVTVSVLVRGAVARHLGLAVGSEPCPVPASGAASAAAAIKLSIRLSAAEAQSLAAGARAAGLSRGAYLAGLIADVPVLSAGGRRPDHLAALIASSAEVSTLSRSLHHLTVLLRQGDVPAARPYREMLDTLASDVRAHLALAANVLAELRPRQGGAPSPPQDHR